jgi:tRNA U54 and U55 pseudouridine synthase Pus10
MKTFYALLIAALFTTAACKKKDEAKTEPANTDPAAKTTEPPATPEPVKAEPPPAEPAAPAVTVDEAGAKVNEFTDKLVQASKDAGADCAKLGTALKALTEDAKAVAAQEKEIEKDAAKKNEFETKFGKAAEAKVKDPMTKIEKCMTNADVKAFIEVLGA